MIWYFNDNFYVNMAEYLYKYTSLTEVLNEIKYSLFKVFDKWDGKELDNLYITFVNQLFDINQILETEYPGENRELITKNIYEVIVSVLTMFRDQGYVTENITNFFEMLDKKATTDLENQN